MFLILCLVLSIATYFVKLPEIVLLYSTILNNPIESIDLTHFPILYHRAKIGVKIDNQNFLPIPVVAKFEGFFGDSQEVFALGQVDGTLIKPFSKNLVELTLVSKINMLEPKIKNLASLGDICGLWHSGKRNVINGRIQSTLSFGWNGIGIPLKTINLPNSTFACPLMETNLSELLLRLGDLLIPYVESLSGVWIDEEMKDRIEYFKY